MPTLFPTFAARPRCAGMKRTIALAALAARGAGSRHRRGQAQARCYRGDFTLVGADGDYVTGKFGKAHLVDGKRNDKLSVHVRRLAKRTTYTFRLQPGSCGGAEVTGWTYRALKTNRKGVGNSWARSRTFKAAKGTKYFVAVYAADGQLRGLRAAEHQGQVAPRKPHGKPHKRAKRAGARQAARQARRRRRGHAEDKDARQARRRARATPKDKRPRQERRGAGPQRSRGAGRRPTARARVPRPGSRSLSRARPASAAARRARPA